MCEYCEEQRIILYTFPVVLKILPVERMKNKKIIEKYYALSINEIAYTKINYCPMCRTKISRRWTKLGRKGGRQ